MTSLNMASRRVVVRLAMVAVIVAAGAGELARYFGEYASTVEASDVFCRRDGAIARELNAQPAAIRRFVLVPRDPFFRYAVDSGAYGHAQPEYVAIPDLLASGDLRGRFPAGAILACQPADARLFLELERRGVALRVEPRGEIAVAFVR